MLGLADHAQSHQRAWVGAWFAHWNRHLAELDQLAVAAAEAGCDAITFGASGLFQAPAQPIGNPGSHQQTLHRLMALDIDIKLHHMGEGDLWEVFVDPGLATQVQHLPNAPAPPNDQVLVYDLELVEVQGESRSRFHSWHVSSHVEL